MPPSAALRVSAVILALCAGCHREAVYPIVGPDGSGMVHVGCEQPGRCYQIAGELCPYGYDLWLAVGTGAENVLVRCRSVRATAQAPAPPLAAAPPPPSAAPLVPPAPAGGQAPWVQVAPDKPADKKDPSWPPAPEPGAWPSAETGNSWPPKPDQATKKDAAGELDVGY